METQCIMERTKSQNTMVKRRKACQNCHDRKVRCVVESSTSVCNNCIQDGVDCYLAKSRRGMCVTVFLSISEIAVEAA